MEELLKTLDINKIEYLHLGYIDNSGKFKRIVIDCCHEGTEEKED